MAGSQAGAPTERLAGPPIMLLVGPAGAGFDPVSAVVRTAIDPGGRVAEGVEPGVAADRPQWLVRFHDELLRGPHVTTDPDAGPTGPRSTDAAVVDRLVAWLREHEDAVRPTAVDDPRALWCLPTWRVAAATVGRPLVYVAAVRPAGGRAHGRVPDPQEHGHDVLAWLNALLRAERDTRHARRVFVEHDRLLEDWRRELQRMDAALGTDLGSAATDPAVGARLDALLRPSSRTGREERQPYGGLPATIAELASSAQSLLAPACLGTRASPDADACDALAARYRDVWEVGRAVSYATVREAGREVADAGALRNEVGELRDRLRRVTEERDVMRAERDELRRNAADHSGGAPRRVGDAWRSFLRRGGT